MDPVLAFITLKTIFINSNITNGAQSVIMAKYILYQGGKVVGKQKQKSNIICGRVFT